ncbi:MAG TPA: hypothetical protein VGO67_14865 [Verrucomicrobiae bacterium]|jgi:hypothetical protein
MKLGSLSINQSTIATIAGIIVLIGLTTAVMRSKTTQNTSTQPRQIHDGGIILLKNGPTNAAVIITVQSLSPEVVDYTWYFRVDGGTTFETNNPKVAIGTVKGARSIAFGSFKIDWSINTVGIGWIYYPSHNLVFKLPWGKWISIPLPGGQAMAVTTERDLAKVDANDPRWTFMKARP